MITVMIMFNVSSFLITLGFLLGITTCERKKDEPVKHPGPTSVIPPRYL